MNSYTLFTLLIFPKGIGQANFCLPNKLKIITFFIQKRHVLKIKSLTILKVFKSEALTILEGRKSCFEIHTHLLLTFIDYHFSF